jgi:hypothetical protein
MWAKPRSNWSILPSTIPQTSSKWQRSDSIRQLRSVKKPTSENVWGTSTETRPQLWRTRDSPRKKIWWILTDPTEDRSVKVRVTANSLNDLRQITQNLVCRGLVSSGNDEVVSTTQGWQNPSCCLNNKSRQHQQATRVAASTKEIHLRYRKNWRISTKVDTSSFQRTGINSIGDSTVSIRPTRDPRAIV